jgi:parvulin-like peptidyl-prolyl isomerase
METQVRLLPLWDIKNQYGERFAADILKLEPEQWQGPIRSGYGLHLVFVTRFVPERLPELNEVLDRVKRDWAVEHQKKLKDAAYAKLKERYMVEIQKPGNLETEKIAKASGRVVTR